MASGSEVAISMCSAKPDINIICWLAVTRQENIDNLRNQNGYNFEVQHSPINRVYTETSFYAGDYIHLDPSD